MKEFNYILLGALIFSGLLNFFLISKINVKNYDLKGKIGKKNTFDLDANINTKRNGKDKKGFLGFLGKNKR